MFGKNKQHEGELHKIQVFGFFTWVIPCMVGCRLV